MSKSRFAGITEQTKAGIRRLRDAEVLRGGKRWLASMYPAGYAVECLLKAKLMRKFGCLELAELADHLRTKRLLGRGDSVFSHQLRLLVRLTGALDRLRMNRDAWIAFNVVNEWVPAWRYSPAERTARQAADFIESVRKVTHWIDVNV
jgi:HEPN domain-containing protein